MKHKNVRYKYKLRSFVKNSYIFFIKKIHMKDLSEYKKQLYSDYIKFINLLYRGNLENQNEEMRKYMYKLLQDIIKEEDKHHYGFIILNHPDHNKLLIKYINNLELFHREEFGYYASEEEFYELIISIRNDFNKYKIDTKKFTKKEKLRKKRKL